MILRRPLIDQIPDQATRESLQWIFDFVTAENMLASNFKHFSLSFNKVETELKIPHGLGFAPIDIIKTYETGNTATFIYEKFDTTNLVLTTTGACVIRFFAGRYQVL